jgi:hypothetical protein
MRDFLSAPQCPGGLWSPSCLLFAVYWGSYPGVQRPGRYGPETFLEELDRTIIIIIVIIIIIIII